MKKIRIAAAAAALAVAFQASAEITVFSQFEEIAERGLVLQYVVQCGSQRYQLSPPSGWQMEARGSDNLILFRNEKLGSVFRLQFCEDAVPGKTIQAALEEKFPGSKTAEKFQCVARDAVGPALDLEFAAADGSLYAARAGLLNYGACQVEFTLTGPAGTVSKSHMAWVTVLNSFSRL